MTRAIQPFHTRLDGDVLYAVTTNEVNVPELASPPSLALIASEVVWDAILNSFPD
jgi:L-aminopeptidase/D-esterase-like protein